MGRGRNEDVYDYDEGMGEKLVAPPDFDGPTSDRHCTDVLCTILMIAMWAAMTAIGAYSYINGDYRVVLFPLDFDGNICGTDFAKNMTDFPFLSYINNYGGGVCVKECPSLVNEVSDNLTDVRTLITYGGVWQAEGAELSPDYIEIANYSDSEDALFCDAEDCFPDSNDPQQSWDSLGISAGFGFAYYAADSYPVLWRCIQSTAATSRIREVVKANTTLNTEETGSTFWSDLYGDIWYARFYILGFGFAVALVISFGYVLLLRIPFLLSLAVWLSIFITVGFFIASGAYAFNQASLWSDEDPQVHSNTKINALRISSFVLFGVGAFLLLLACCLRRQIQLAIGCVKEAGRAMHRMPGIIFVPVLQGFGLVAFMIPLTIYAVHLVSLGQLATEDFSLGVGDLEIAIHSWDFDVFVERCAWYLLFCLFWTGNFIVAVGDMVIAMCVAKWYFARDKHTINSCVVLSSVCQTMYYHLGTCAYGSLVLAIVQIVRAILARIQREVKKIDSKIANVLLCCCQCCLWCFEKCLKFLNKNAYVQTAIFGTAFCKSAREAFLLILRNAGRISAITYVSGAVLFIGKLFISATTTSLSYYVMTELIEDEVFSLAGPTVFVFVISYFVSDMFMDIYDMCITTVLQCFVADEEMFESRGQCYAEDRLREYIDDYED